MTRTSTSNFSTKMNDTNTIGRFHNITIRMFRLTIFFLITFYCNGVHFIGIIESKEILMKRVHVLKEDMGFRIYGKHVCFQVLG